MNPILLIAFKDLRQLLRDRGSLFWVFVFPLIFAGFFSAVMTFAMKREQQALFVVVADDAKTEASGRLLQHLRDHEQLDVTEQPLDEAQRLVQRGKLVAFVHVPKGFGEESSVGQLALGLGLDPTRKAEAAMLRGILIGELLASSQAGASKAAAAPVAGSPSGGTGRSQVYPPELPTITSVPLSPLEHPRTPLDLAFPAAILWGLMGCAASFAVNLVSERKSGALIRLRAAPIGAAQILAGKALSCFLACGATSLFIAFIAIGLLGVRPVNPSGLALGLFTVALCFVGITTALSVAGESEQSVAGAGWGTLVLFAMIGGAMVPLDVMPDWMQSLGHLSPVKWGIRLLEGTIWRDYSAAELMLPSVALIAIGLMSFALGVTVLARKQA